MIKPPGKPGPSIFLPKQPQRTPMLLGLWLSACVCSPYGAPEGVATHRRLRPPLAEPRAEVFARAVKAVRPVRPDAIAPLRFNKVPQPWGSGRPRVNGGAHISPVNRLPMNRHLNWVNHSLKLILNLQAKDIIGRKDFARWLYPTTFSDIFEGAPSRSSISLTPPRLSPPGH